ncbi:hypothetical protein Glove_33g300 [Diversispora epigaea]|uniref:Uncharacterized protein n=1 Tax=Diversispora epigaea TaxID=1348612 RepID=A0A397JT03_9GLOM|nr:hypothetical protein Glove_33g300 [Diversispora epigaea]
MTVYPPPSFVDKTGEDPKEYVKDLCQWCKSINCDPVVGIIYKSEFISFSKDGLF